MSGRLPLLILLLGLSFAPFGAKAEDAPASTTSPTVGEVKTADENVVQILFTHDGMGELEPCGCRANPLGGVVRRSALTERLKKEVPRTFSVENGNSFFENTVTPPALEKVLGFQSEKIAESFRLFPLHLFVPGEKDFSLGYAHFKKLKKISGIPFLAANLVEKSGGLTFVKSKTDSLGKKKLLWIGLVGTDLKLPKELKATDPFAAVRTIIGKKKDPNRVIVVLSELGMEKDKALAAKFPEITLILGSRDQSFTQNPVRIDGLKTVLLQTSYRNQHLGRVRLNLDTLAVESEMVPLDESFDNDPAEAAKVLVADWKKGVARIEGEEEAKALNEAFPKGSTHFQTFPQCFQCHEGVFDFWRKTPHANALKPLREKNLLAHPTCLGCHTVSIENPALLVTQEGSSELKKGSWEETAFLMDEIVAAEKLETPIRLYRDAPPKPMRDVLSSLEKVGGSVQCENCHQSATNHPFGNKLDRTVAQSTCLKCHTKEQAPAWYDSKGLNQTLFAENLKKVQCPRTEISPSETSLNEASATSPEIQKK